MQGHILLDSDLSVESQRNEVFKWALAGVRNVMLRVKESPKEPWINPYILLDVLVHTKRDLSQFQGPDEFKTGGHLCFWISRLKPFRHFISQNPFYSNEVMALQIGLALVRETKGHGKTIPYEVLANLLYELRYGYTSAFGVTNKLQLLYC